MYSQHGMYSRDWWNANDRTEKSKKHRTAKEHEVEQQSDTTTEHAVEQQSDTATEHAGREKTESRSSLNPTEMRYEVWRSSWYAKKDAQADQADNTMDNLVFKLLEFLIDLLRQAWTVPSGRPRPPDTEQAASSGYAKEEMSSEKTWELLKEENLDDMVPEEQCEDIVFEKIAEWAGRYSETHFYSEPELLIHKKMFDIMTRNKEGLSKENTFIEWCRRVHRHTKAPSTAVPSIATEHAEAASTATEHDESPTYRALLQREANCFKSLALDLLSNDLTPEQRRDAKYKIRKNTKTGEIHVTTKQRSWINAILRKNFGDAKVTYFISNHGLPALLDVSLRRKAPSKAMLQNMLEELMTWHASLLQSILEHQNHSDMANARKLAALDQTVWRMHRRERKKEAQQRMVQGSRLVKERDSSKRNFEDMSAAEQQVLEDFDTGRSAQRHAKECEKKLPCFRGKML